jgi:hypothetical protein
VDHIRAACVTVTDSKNRAVKVYRPLVAVTVMYSAHTPSNTCYRQVLGSQPTETSEWTDFKACGYKFCREVSVISKKFRKHNYVFHKEANTRLWYLSPSKKTALQIPLSHCFQSLRLVCSSSHELLILGISVRIFLMQWFPLAFCMIGHGRTPLDE